MAGAERWAINVGGSAYAIDDQTAIKVNADAINNTIAWSFLFAAENFFIAL